MEAEINHSLCFQSLKINDKKRETFFWGEKNMKKKNITDNKITILGIML